MIKSLDRHKSARRNLMLYPIQKIFNKRVFLPIIPIFYIDYVGFSIEEVGVLAAIYALINLLFNMPSGYFSDRFGRTKALRIGAALLLISTLFYAGMPTKSGVLIGAIFESIGFAFLSGSGESLIHDSLQVLGREKDYSKVLSRAQSIALVINAGLVALVPITYAIDPRAPFVLGALAFLTLLVAAFLMRDVTKHEIKKPQFKGLIALERLSGNMPLFLAIMLFGVIGAVYFSFDIVTVALREFGLNPEYLGTVFASASLIGAGLGLVVHKLKQISLSAYMIVDSLVLLTVYFAGFSGNLWSLIAAAVLSISFWRYRRIIYQDHLLTRFRTGYKSTLLSVMNTTESVNMLWVPIVTTAAVGGLGVINGFGLLGVGILCICSIYFVAMRYAFSTRM